MSSIGRGGQAHATQGLPRRPPSRRPDEPRPNVVARGFALVVAGPLAYVIPLLWIAFAVWASIHLPSISQSSGALGDLTAPNAPAIAAQKLDARLFAVPAISRVAVVQHSADSLPASVLLASAGQAVAVDRHTAATVPPGLLGALPIVNQPGLVPASSQTRTTAITYLVFNPTLDWNVQFASAQQYAHQLSATPGSAVVGVTGVVPARLEQGNAILDRLNLIEIATVVLIALIVGITFRALGAPLVTLGAGVVAYVVASHVVAWFGQHTGTSAPQELQPLMIVLLLGIVTDYSIFFSVGAAAAPGRRAGPRAGGSSHDRRVPAHDPDRRHHGGRRHRLSAGRLAVVLPRLGPGHGAHRAHRAGGGDHLRARHPGRLRQAAVLAARPRRDRPGGHARRRGAAGLEPGQAFAAGTFRELCRTPTRGGR